MKRLDPFHTSLASIRQAKPLVHCITNYVTANDCANMVLACGGAPIMADDALEVEDITTLCSSLVINIGTLNSRTVESMILAGMRANELGHPIVLDPVGAGASRLRTQTIQKLLTTLSFAVIKGNISEIKATALGHSNTKGVDANSIDHVTEESLPETILFAQKLAKETGAIIVITGLIDIMADESNAFVLRNGHALMGQITGTGCMLGAMIGAFIGADPSNALLATTAAVCTMGVCGEQAGVQATELSLGTASFKTLLINAVSNMEDKTLKAGATIEHYS